VDKQVWFAHGKESGPWGRKIQALAVIAQARGFSVESPDYSHSFDPEVRIRQLLDLRPHAECLVLVGSSMGGYVSAVASSQLSPAGLFLMAPAFYMPGYEEDPAPSANLIDVVHGWDDDVIPVAHSIRFAQRHSARLHAIPGDHGLVGQLPLLEQLFGLFLDEVEKSVASEGPA